MPKTCNICNCELTEQDRELECQNCKNIAGQKELEIKERIKIKVEEFERKERERKEIERIESEIKEREKKAIEADEIKKLAMERAKLEIEEHERNDRTRKEIERIELKIKELDKREQEVKDLESDYLNRLLENNRRDRNNNAVEINSLHFTSSTDLGEVNTKIKTIRMTPRTALQSGALNGLLAVAAGAFATHGLKSQLTADLLAIWQTGVQYQAMHALALLAVGLLTLHHPSRAGRLAGWLFLGGILIFSGSLYLLALTGVRWLGAITPLGGGAFLGGWLALLVAARNLRPGEIQKE